jgi:two-component system CheB/CheR fusion protein
MDNAQIDPAAGTTPPPPMVVALGASAGGLEALERFFSTVQPAGGMAFVVLQHLDPNRESLLVDILQRSTRLPVVEATDGMPVQPGRIHVMPPNRDMSIQGGQLHLSALSEARSSHMAIDGFLRTLADDVGENAVAIILSGTGTDGTLGLRAVLGAGGLCLVQDPATTRFDGMPRSAQRYASRVLPVEDMPRALDDAWRALLQHHLGQATPGAAALGKVLVPLRLSTGHDFAQYKASTIERRIQRRMLHHQLATLDDYAALLKRDPAEVQALFQELLINVTSFFRDPQAFALLKSEILPALLAGAAEGQVLRVWVAACASGEEAYSIAMLLREWMDEAQVEVQTQIYATDLDSDAVATARAGLYPFNIAQDLSPDRLRRFFLKEPTGLRIKKEIREMIVFAVQSVIKDPPFTRIDLLACRNLMIYLEPELQDRLVRMFHLALRPGGVLFLSPSESTGDHPELFEVISRPWKFFRARPVAQAGRALAASGMPWGLHGGGARVQQPGSPPPQSRVADLARRALLQAFAPASVVTDLQGNLLYVQGETGKFLRPAPGHPTLQLADLARGGVDVVLREALQQASSQGLPTLNRIVRLQQEDGTPGASLSLSVRPMHDPEGGEPMLLVSFQELADLATPARARRPRAGSAAELSRIELLQRELTQARQSMQVMVEEQQAANEDLKSTNEELQSTNEELQSTNEELETSREELQSVNEELVTVNAELQHKIDQMSDMQDDLKNLLDNIRLGTVFLDRDLQIRRFTQEAARVYRLAASDVGRPLADIRCDLVEGDLIPEATQVLQTLQTLEREVSTPAGTWFLARIQPYRTVDNAIDGVVLTFADITERIQFLAVRQARDLAEAIVDSVRQPLVVLDGDLTVLSANRAFYDTFGLQAQACVGHAIFELGERRWDLPVVHNLLEAALTGTGGTAHGTVDGRPGDPQPRLQLSARCITAVRRVDPIVMLSFEPEAVPAS